MFIYNQVDNLWWLFRTLHHRPTSLREHKPRQNRRLCKIYLKVRYTKDSNANDIWWMESHDRKNGKNSGRLIHSRLKERSILSQHFLVRKSGTHMLQENSSLDNKQPTSLPKSPVKENKTMMQLCIMNLYSQEKSIVKLTEPKETTFLRRKLGPRN